MDVKLHTIVSRFPFPFPTLDDDDEVLESTSHAAESVGGRAPRRVAPLVSSHRATAEGVDGAHAYVLAAAATSSPSVTESARSSPSRKGVSRGTESVDLTKLASRLWNTELQRAAATAAPTVCVFRPPPFVLDHTAYRGASVYVLPSGVVRLVTYGAVTATLRIARRVQAMLGEAYLPSVARRAAREERRLLRAVLDAGSDEVGRAKCEEGAKETAPTDAGVSLAAALASNDERSPRSFLLTRPPGRTGRTHADATPTHRDVKGKRARAQQGRTVEHAEELPDTALKIDFIQSMATPRWDEVAGLREAFFAETNRRGNAEASPAVVSASVAVGQAYPLSDTHDCRSAPGAPSQGEITADSALFFSLKSATPVRVARASVNVRGDAPMAWWRWYLAASTQRDRDGPLLDSSSGAGAQLTAADRSSAKDQDDENSATATMEHADGTGGFWTCAGHKEVSPTSHSAAFFVRYLQHKRSFVPHHVVSFKVRRNASLSSIQLLLEWNAAAPPASGRNLQRSVLTTPRVPLQTSLRLPLGSASAANYSAAAKTDEDAQPSGAHVGGEAPPASSTAAAAGTQHSPEAWVTEASAANFFLESTFIAESAAPYGLESTRASTGREAETSLPPVSEGSSSSFDVSAGKRGRAEKALSPASDFHDLQELHPSAKVTVKESWKRQRHTQAVRAAAPATTEPVSCLIYRSGRVRLTTGSEAAIRQLCDVLLIPFLVATADLAL
ncbi:hypothetical protein ABB37_01956 [Leptomonas pyrrhocoris]|uniref:Uncharacterized protein n=1 Tax=Leptomonas pyrrhocoris TaxID=157538 RepID=A0A0N0DY86_LEPPY|nr:hypothetical protein ABB37_01956 [Leptomonas pyrrhocoris]KPA83702.1 hypothetical protein ABB37_01956 [Leptomonas pyrrhocoris]|eukprot:XP_015662141.1 hypothetical protein ABB37_01956 [Leptomonas pyrrhocoris]